MKPLAERLPVHLQGMPHGRHWSICVQRPPRLCHFQPPRRPPAPPQPPQPANEGKHRPLPCTGSQKRTRHDTLSERRLCEHRACQER
jgi:hypothetical protein